MSEIFYSLWEIKMINCPKFKDNGLQMHAYDYIFVIVNASAFEKKNQILF